MRLCQGRVAASAENTLESMRCDEFRDRPWSMPVTTFSNHHKEPAMPAIDSHPDGVAVWIDLSSTEPDRAATFYGDLFGWDRTEPDEQMGGYSQFTHQDKLVAGLGPKQSPDVPDFWCTYFQTPDIEATVKQVSTSGGSVFVPPMEIPGQGTMAIVMDPGSDPGPTVATTVTAPSSVSGNPANTGDFSCTWRRERPATSSCSPPTSRKRSTSIRRPPADRS